MVDNVWGRLAFSLLLSLCKRADLECFFDVGNYSQKCALGIKSIFVNMEGGNRKGKPIIGQQLFQFKITSQRDQ